MQAMKSVAGIFPGWDYDDIMGYTDLDVITYFQPGIMIMPLPMQSGLQNGMVLNLIFLHIKNLPVNGKGCLYILPMDVNIVIKSGRAFQKEGWLI